MELSKTLLFQGWSIKYELLSPENHQDSASQSLKTVVFVHGTPWSSVTFFAVAGAVVALRQHRVLLYDLPGYGQSQTYAKPSSSGQVDISLFEGDTSVKFQARALDSLLQKLGIDGRDDHEAPVVIAHDIAGTIALRTLLLHGCRFHSLMLMDTNAVLPWGDGFYKLARAQPQVFCDLPANIFEGMLKAVIESACWDPRRLDAFYGHHLRAPWLSLGGDEGKVAVAQRSFVRQIAQANDDDVAEMLDADMYSRVSCPVKILWGAKDKWIPREKMEQLVELLGDACKEFVTVPRAGHLVMIDEPERVTAEVISWLMKY